MRSRSHRIHKDPPELDITAFLNLMVVLVPFLLITAVFSRITILQLDLPASSTATEESKKEVKVEVIVRQERIDISDGEQVIFRIPNLPLVQEVDKNDEPVFNQDGSAMLRIQYDIPKLSEILYEIKGNHPQKLNATVLMEQSIEYEYLVQIMDAVSAAERKNEDNSIRKIELFPEISVGDAPGGG